MDMGISIRAPVWGAIKDADNSLPTSAYFNPRTRVGCDCNKHWRNAYYAYFNPRTRVGCDWLTIISKYGQTYFNPRTRVGCDGEEGLKKIEPKVISIRAPVWGAIGC